MTVELPNIRKLFVPDPGYVIFDADLAGADAQVVAAEAGDSDLLAAFKGGLDVHTKNATDLGASRSPYLRGRERKPVASNVSKLSTGRTTEPTHGHYLEYSDGPSTKQRISRIVGFVSIPASKNGIRVLKVICVARGQHEISADIASFISTELTAFCRKLRTDFSINRSHMLFSAEPYSSNSNALGPSPFYKSTTPRLSSTYRTSVSHNRNRSRSLQRCTV